MLAEHLLRPGVKEFCVQRGSNFYVWLLMQDGSVAVLTLNPEQKVTAWQRMVFPGRRVLQIATLPSAEGHEDEVWFVLQNESAGFISLERICAASGYADALTVVRVTEAGRVSGLPHLAGMQVRYAVGSSLSNGAALATVAADGSLAIPGATVGQSYAVGLPYESVIQTLPLESQLSFNSVRQMSRVRLRLMDSEPVFDYKSTNADRWEQYDGSRERLCTPYSGSVRLHQLPRPGVEQGFCLRYSGVHGFNLLSLTVEVDYHGK